MADFFDGFNFDPINNLEDSASYTVPSGGYAIMTVTLSATMQGSVTGIINANNNWNVSSCANATTLELRLKEGSIVTKTETTGSNTNDQGNGGTGFLFLTGTSVATVLVDGVAVGTIRATAHASLMDDSGVAGTSHTVVVTGTADVEWHIAEYNKQGN